MSQIAETCRREAETSKQGAGVGCGACENYQPAFRRNCCVVGTILFHPRCEVRPWLCLLMRALKTLRASARCIRVINTYMEMFNHAQQW